MPTTTTEQRGKVYSFFLLHSMPANTKQVNV